MDVKKPPLTKEEKRERLARECELLNPRKEQEMAEEVTELETDEETAS